MYYIRRISNKNTVWINCTMYNIPIELNLQGQLVLFFADHESVFLMNEVDRPDDRYSQKLTPCILTYSSRPRSLAHIDRKYNIKLKEQI